MKQVNVILFLQNKNKTRSQTQLYLKKNITFIKLHISSHNKSSSGLCTKPVLKGFVQRPDDGSVWLETCSCIKVKFFLKQSYLTVCFDFKLHEHCTQQDDSFKSAILLTSIAVLVNTSFIHCKFCFIPSSHLSCQRDTKKPSIFNCFLSNRAWRTEAESHCLSV